MSTRDQIGPCRHRIFGGICGACTIDNYWRAVLAQIPSRHFRGERGERATAFRLRLAEEVLERSAGGGRDGPVRYLEIGVRRGHSFALTCLAAGNRLEVAIGVDAWIENYAGEPNAGADAVRANLGALGIDLQKTSMLTGDSHQIVPLLQEQPFNLILVDGDHSEIGAKRDLYDALDLLEPGGLLIFDDAVAKGDDRLLKAWRQVTRGNPKILAAGEELNDRPAWTWARRAGG